MVPARHIDAFFVCRLRVHGLRPSDSGRRTSRTRRQRFARGLIRGSPGGPPGTFHMPEHTAPRRPPLQTDGGRGGFGHGRHRHRLAIDACQSCFPQGYGEAAPPAAGASYRQRYVWVCLLFVSPPPASARAERLVGADARRLSAGAGPAAKRLQTLQYLIGALQKLAATRNCAVVVLSQCATKLQSDGGATLTPSLNANVWEQGVSTRLVLFRDWVWKDQDPSSVWFAGVQKLEGRTGPETIQSTAAFRVESVSAWFPSTLFFFGPSLLAGQWSRLSPGVLSRCPLHSGALLGALIREMRLCKGPRADIVLRSLPQTGLVEMQHDASQASMVVPAASRQKRKLGDTGLEIPDSDEDDEDYGWQVDDDAAAPVPPQTQGSEDLILGVHRYEDDDEDADDDEAGGGGAEDGSGANGALVGVSAGLDSGEMEGKP